MSKRSKNIGCFPFILSFIVMAMLASFIEKNFKVAYDNAVFISFIIVAFLGIFIFIINIKLNNDNIHRENTKNIDYDEDYDNTFPEEYLIKEPEYSARFLRERLLANSYVEEEDAEFEITDFYPLEKEEINIKIGFSKSSSVIFEEVLNEFKTLGTFKEDNSNNKSSKYEAIFSKKNLAEAIYFWDKIKNWKSSYILFNNENIKNNTSLLRCLENRLDFNDTYCRDYNLRDPEPDLFNLHLFPCREIKIYANECMRDIGCWYKFSKYDYDNDKIVIDKKRILEIMKADLKYIRFCPFINLYAIWQKFLHIPKEITLDNPHFAIIKTENGEIKLINRWDHIRMKYLNYKYLKAKYGKNLLSKV